jgi:hypothetical protein
VQHPGSILETVEETKVMKETLLQKLGYGLPETSEERVLLRPLG